MFCQGYDSFVDELKKRGFTVHDAKDGAEALETALKTIGKSATVGFGGSMTVKELGLPDALRAQGNKVFFHWDAPPEERDKVFESAAVADWYVCSANAITRNAKIINIDGNGNRVSGTFYGPRRKVMLIIGKNKFAEDIEAGFERAKKFACAKNAQRFGFKTPCVVTGKCTDCYSPQRICKITTIIECLPGFVQELHLILVDEELGY